MPSATVRWLAPLALLAAPTVHAAPVSPYYAAMAAEPATPDADGFIRRWRVLEPVVKPNRTNDGFTAAYVRAAFAAATPPGIGRSVPRDGAKATVAGASLAWHALDARLFDVKLFNLAQDLGKPVYGVIFWVTTVIEVPQDTSAHLAVGSNSASVWWVNGTETAGLFGDRRMVMDDVVSPRVTLHKGRNVIHGAVINGPGLSDFCLRLVDDQGAPLRGFTLPAQ